MLLFDTLSKKQKELIWPKNKTLRLFVCGPTVYDLSHIGHARTYVMFDSFVKYLKFKKIRIFYLQNITDVDDKIIQKADKEKTSAKSVAKRFEKEYLKDMNALGVTSVDKYSRASEYIIEIIDQINLLIKRGYAYITPSGVYFRVKNFKTYGKLSGQKIKKLSTAVNIEKDPRKEHAQDFALWKIIESKNKFELSWQSPWGKGRPGWHIEDTAITYKEFKSPQYEIHGGARDLIFPHHEAEIAQMEAAYGKSPLVKYWMHTGFLQIENEKMAKSLKNFITIRDILKNYSSQTLRLFFATKHYRSPIDYTKGALEEAETNEKKLTEFLKNLKYLPRSKNADKKVNEYIKKFWNFLEDDFNTPQAFAQIFQLISYIYTKNCLNNFDVKTVKIFFKNVNSIFNILNTKEKNLRIPNKILNLVQKREDFRKTKNWERADAIRKQIEKLGYTLEDTDTGSKIKHK